MVTVVWMLSNPLYRSFLKTIRRFITARPLLPSAALRGGGPGMEVNVPESARLHQPYIPVGTYSRAGTTLPAEQPTALHNGPPNREEHRNLPGYRRSHLSPLDNSPFLR
jgi:hypothetical protein